MPIFDLHSHFSFKPANSRAWKSGDLPDDDHWKERFTPKSDYGFLSKTIERDVIKTSQLHADSATQGGFRVICNGLYPIERGFISGLVLKDLATFTGYSKGNLKQIKRKKISYFEVLQREFKNVHTNQGSRGSLNGNSYRLVDSFKEILSYLKKDPNTICILNSVEGVHAFADDLFTNGGRYININKAEEAFVNRKGEREGNTNFEKYIERICANIDKSKSDWALPPFFVTLSHHYYSHVAGHSPSLSGIVTLLVGQKGKAKEEVDGDEHPERMQYFHIGIQRWGYRILENLVTRKTASNETVRRVLVDLKHMSPKARSDYYAWREQYCRERDEHIPIIYSHTGISGRKDLERTVNDKRAGAKKFKRFDDETLPSKYFYDGVINLFDNEIPRIIDSDGLIGLMIDERRIMGREIPPEGLVNIDEFRELSRKAKRALNIYFQFRHKIAWVKEDSNWQKKKAKKKKVENFEFHIQRNIRDYPGLNKKLKVAYSSVIFRQIFHLLEVYGDKKAWDHLSLGTDYDGVINPIDSYVQSYQMANLEKDLIGFWDNQCKNGKTAAIRSLYTKHKYGRSAQHWIKKLLWLNGLNFLKKYYNDEYLLKGLPTQRGWALTKEEEKALKLKI